MMKMQQASSAFQASVRQTSADKIIEAPSVDESTKRASTSTNGVAVADPDAKPKSKWGKVGSVMKLVNVTGALNVQEDNSNSKEQSEAILLSEDTEKKALAPKQSSKWGKVGAVMKLAKVKPIDPARNSTESMKN